jgi:hypothetical protein
MACFNNAGYGFLGDKPRVTLCLSEELKFDVSCPDPDITWGGGETVDTVPLVLNEEYTVTADCEGCGDPIMETYCAPFLYPVCGVNLGIFDPCTGTETSNLGYAMQVEYCTGNDIDGASIEFNYLRVPAGLTVALTNNVDWGGNIWALQFQATVNWATFEYPGTYYVAVRIADVNGIKSNWSILRITISFTGEEATCC